MRFKIILVAALAAGTAMASAGAAQARDAALILGTERYERLGRVLRGADVVDAGQGLAVLGFDVTALPNGRAGTTAAALAGWLADVPGADRLVVVLSGRFATDGRRSWFLTAELAEPGLVSLGARAVSVDSLLQVLGDRPGRALLLLAAEEGGDAYDPWLRAGLGDLEIPQGVTVLRTEPRLAADLLRDLAQPLADPVALARDNRRVSLSGFAPDSLIFMPAEADVAPPPPEDTPEPDTGAELALWQGAEALDTVQAYRNYLARYPAGQFAAAAEEAIAAIIAEPNRDARLAEEALSLTRDARRDIQRSLTLLEYNTRGIDGIFGPGTRGAITNWQQQNGFAQTSYLTGEQIARLDAQAARRAAELEAQAERQRAAEALRDRSFWEETGARGDEPGLRAYLDRYPDGIFAGAATERLAVIEEAKRAEAAAEDRAAWDNARTTDTPAAYQDYLRVFPQGRFQPEASARIAELAAAQDGAAEERAAAAQEAALDLNPLTIRLIEARLDQLGLEPGAVDGRIDEDFRRALRRYQRDRDLPPTGYLSEQALIRLLADSFENR